MVPLDCEVDGVVVAEGSAVSSRDNCSACFCLRGAVRCQPLGCAAALAGCRPLRAPGDCCAHQYVCDHDDTGNIIFTIESSLVFFLLSHQGKSSPDAPRPVERKTV